MYGIFSHIYCRSHPHVSESISEHTIHGFFLVIQMLVNIPIYHTWIYNGIHGAYESALVNTSPRRLWIWLWPQMGPRANHTPAAKHWARYFKTQVIMPHKPW
jgi:hypothetical protein